MRSSHRQHGRLRRRPKIFAAARSARWRPSLFDHETRTTFPLQGAHRNVRCEGCHKNVRLVAGKQVLFYKATPGKCVDCHGPTGKPEGKVGALQPGWVELRPRMAM